MAHKKSVPLLLTATLLSHALLKSRIVICHFCADLFKLSWKRGCLRDMDVVVK